MPEAAAIKMPIPNRRYFVFFQDFRKPLSIPSIRFFEYIQFSGRFQQKDFSKGR